MASKRYQTLSDFVVRPFGKVPDANKNKKYETEYTDLVRYGGIKLSAVTTIGTSYYYHITIPSKSHKDNNVKYDVVIRFFTDDPIVLGQPNLSKYYIQFFSNSPSFIYSYAYVYKQNGYLIEDLFEKLDGNYEDVPPKNTNPDQNIAYDKSIYMATRFLQEKGFRYLAKRGVILMKLVNKDRFFRRINSFENVKIIQDIITEENKLQRELEKKSITRGDTVTPDRTTGGITVKSASTSTSKDKTESSIKVISKKRGGNVKPKKKATTSTRKK